MIHMDLSLLSPRAPGRNMSVPIPLKPPPKGKGTRFIHAIGNPGPLSCPNMNRFLPLAVFGALIAALFLVPSPSGDRLTAFEVGSLLDEAAQTD